MTGCRSDGHCSRVSFSSTGPPPRVKDPPVERYNSAMGPHSHNSPSAGEADAVAAAVEVCRQNYCRGVLSDPLSYAEYDSNTDWYDNNSSRTPETETYTRPKPGGGTRIEVAPDFHTSVRLQVVAGQVAEAKPPRAYEQAQETVSMWIRHALVEGMTVVVADVEDYFESIPPSRIKRALHCLGLDEANIEIALQAIHRINAVPDGEGATRKGLPVSRDDLVWLIADAVLRPIDDHLSAQPVVSRHIRQVDDFFIAAYSDDVRGALESLSEALAAEGLRLNESKTRVFDDLPEYERYAMTYEHRLLTSLAMVSHRTELASSQQRAFEDLIEAERLGTREHARVWKRTYALAEGLGSAALVPAALEDLRRYPTAAVRIASYLRSLNWPSGTAAGAIEGIAHAPTDSQAIALLRALLSAEQALSVSVVEGLRKVAESMADRMHPYTSVLLHACLMLGQPRPDRQASEALLALASRGRSPLARRIAIELLWLIPQNRGDLVKLILRDTNPTVRGLSLLPAIAGAGLDQAEARGDERVTDPSWHGLGSEIRSTWMNAPP